MTDATPAAAAAPKKRSLFKRAAWQDAPKSEGDDIFSHSKDFQSIVAQQNKVQDEKRRLAAAERAHKHAAPTERKRRKVSSEHDEPARPGSRSGSSSRPGRTGSKGRSETPLSLSPTQPLPQPNSLAARYDTLAGLATAHQQARKESVIIDLGGSDDDADDSNSLAYNAKSYGSNHGLNPPLHGIPMRPTSHVIDDADDDPEEALDPALAALAARARARAASRAQTATKSAATGEHAKAPVAQLFISPEIPDAKPLMVKVRVDSTLERTRQAWCKLQGYSSDMVSSVFFTWKGTRVYDSTTIKRLGIHVDANGNVSVDGDSNMYDDVNLPKVHVEAWTDDLFQQHKKEQAVAMAAKRKAAEPPPVIEEREPTPEPVLKVKKIRLIMKAKGHADFKLFVKSETTVAHIAGAFKSGRNIEESQPITLMFDGDRLVPMDTIAGCEIEDMDSIDVFFK